MSSSDFPFRVYTNQEAQDDLHALIKIVSQQVKSRHIKKPNSCGYVGANRFFQYERMNTPSQGKPSPMEQWNKNRDKIIDYYNKKGTGDLFRSIVFFTKACNEFSPHVSAGVYRYFDARFVTDWFAGWGNRMYGAVAYGCRYTGYDSNPNLIEPYQKMIDYYQPYTKGKLTFHCTPSENTVLEDGCDLVFSSPPFWTKSGKLLESYHQCQSNYETFLEGCLLPLMRQAKEKGVPVALYIPEEMANRIDRVERHTLKLTFGDDVIFCWTWKEEKEEKEEPKKEKQEKPEEKPEDVESFMKRKLLTRLRGTIYWEPSLETRSVPFLEQIVTLSKLC